MENQKITATVSIDKTQNKVIMDLDSYKLIMNSINKDVHDDPQTLNSYCCIVCKDGELLSVANVNKETKGEALVECSLICENLNGDRYSVADTPCADVDDPGSTCTD
jgi:hypothetical protein